MLRIYKTIDPGSSKGQIQKCQCHERQKKEEEEEEDNELP